MPQHALHIKDCGSQSVRPSAFTARQQDKNLAEQLISQPASHLHNQTDCLVMNKSISLLIAYQSVSLPANQSEKHD